MKDRKQIIAETAGKIWKLLAKKGQVNAAELPKLLKEQRQISYQALGWLAREDKVVYSEKDRKNFISLTAAEQDSARQIGVSGRKRRRKTT